MSNWKRIPGNKTNSFIPISTLCCIHTSIHWICPMSCQSNNRAYTWSFLWCSTMQDLQRIKRTCVTLSVVRNANTLRGVAVPRWSRWSPHAWSALTTWKATRPSGARRPRGSGSWLSGWPCKWEREGEWSQPEQGVSTAKHKTPLTSSATRLWKRWGFTGQQNCNFNFSVAQLKRGMQSGLFGITPAPSV